MSRFQECFKPQGAKAVLLSVKPRFADQIIAGTKRVEFRRAWAKESVGLLVIYSSSPVQRIVGMVDVEGVVSAAPAKVWAESKSRGPGLPRKELMEYFAEKQRAHGILLGQIATPARAINPTSVFKEFRAPQSFRYLTPTELRAVGRKFDLPEVSA